MYVYFEKSQVEARGKNNLPPPNFVFCGGTFVARDSKIANANLNQPTVIFASVGCRGCVVVRLMNR